MPNTQNKRDKKEKVELTEMRLDKFLKVSRIVKRRTVAKDFCDTDRVWVNERDAKPATKLKTGDTLRVKFGRTLLTVKITNLNDKAKKDDAKEMYEVISEERVDE